MRHAYLRRRRNVAARVGLDAKALDELALRPKEAERKEDKLRFEILLRSWNLFHAPATAAILGPLDAN